MRSHPNPKNWLEQTVNELDIKYIEKNKWVEFLFSQAKQWHNFNLEELKNVYMDMENVPEVFEKYGEAFNSAVSQGEKIKSAFSDSWDSVHTLLQNFSEQKLKPCKYEDKEYLESVKDVRKRYLDAVKEIKKEYITSNIDYLNTQMKDIGPIIKEICSIIKELEETFQTKKQEINSLDYSDLEHMALKLLYDFEKNQPTSIAEEISESTYDILFDAFHDTNDIQDKIFEIVKASWR